MGAQCAPILGVTPRQEQAAQRALTRATAAHMAYRLEPGLQLLRYRPQAPGQGGLLYCGGQGTLRGDASELARTLFWECHRQGYRGVIADLPPGHVALARTLGEALSQQELSLYVPEHSAAEHCRVLVSTALSGGSLEQHLTRALARYGPVRTVAALERVCAEFVLPAPEGQGKKLTQEAFAQRRGQISAGQIFWSKSLCVHYFTYTQAGQVRMVLFDDQESMAAKLALAGKVGIEEVFVLWRDLGNLPGR